MMLARILLVLLTTAFILAFGTSCRSVEGESSFTYVSPRSPAGRDIAITARRVGSPKFEQRFVVGLEERNTGRQTVWLIMADRKLSKREQELALWMMRGRDADAPNKHVRLATRLTARPLEILDLPKGYWVVAAKELLDTSYLCIRRTKGQGASDWFVVDASAYAQEDTEWVFPRTLTHTVTGKESLSFLGEMYCVPVKTLLEANPDLKPKGNLDPGTEVTIPF